MARFGGVEPQRFGDRAEGLVRGLHVAALLQPCVPSGPDPGDHRDFLATKPRRAAARARRQADVGRRQTFAPRAEERAELAASDVVDGGRLARVHGAR